MNRVEPAQRVSGLRPLIICALLTALAAVASCGGGRATRQAKRYELRGTIVSFNKAQRQVVVSHEDVPGLMEGMTMPFTLEEESAYDVMRAGDRVQATLVVDGARSWLESPVITSVVRGANQPASASQPVEPQPGAAVPDFALVNQDGKKFKLSRYLGKAYALTFIYTRCPLPDYCTLMSDRFADLNRALAAEPELAARARLLSVTVDPAYDTPKVLRSYGAAHTGNYADEKFERWELATGDEAEVRRMANFFGLVYDREGGQIVHSLRTAVVTPEGTLYKLYRGNTWKPEEIAADLRSLVATK